jgi:hypothetical protein
MARRILLRRALSALIMSGISSGLESTALEDRDDAPTAKPHTLELPINEELEAKLLALHDSGRQELFTIVGVKKMSSSCFATASVFCLKSHPKTGTRER